MVKQRRTFPRSGLRRVRVAVVVNYQRTTIEGLIGAQQ